MENKGLIFIPDISGFSRFVSEMEIEHSRLIIGELLEILIDANHTGLTVSEIEGDAILFYKFGERPPLKEVYGQVKGMFEAFHKNLMTYENRRYCQCKACMSAIGLTLKVITHYGEFTGYKVKDFNKLIGKDIIVAHRLLKNDIANHEYWLVTAELAKNNPLSDLDEWIAWRDSKKLTEEGPIAFRYAQLGPLKEQLPQDPIQKLDLTEKTKVLTFTREYKTDIITLLHAAADFNYRSRWMQGVKNVQVENHFLPRIGLRCKIISDRGEAFTYANHYSYQKERIEFSEVEEGTETLSHYTLKKLGDRKTRLTLDYYIKKNLFSKLMFDLRNKDKVKSTITKSLQNLDGLVGKIRVPESSVRI
ncbi:DUF2652 domain-containing protein [Galbibacter sp. EGI 63066]|uniref:DUF2652 domain-containing protein n=1 Tax=Galbibacter sp. EGI 63066 TaxID=2993559 RepID=UPI00224902E0|nr:DUF2652 domain-containing protein [Galbibacter sp. EGI 63066]MCX2678697.1 DUF2652 domain-containing protein [Galbibacter sp. EGI 63066]